MRALYRFLELCVLPRICRLHELEEHPKDHFFCSAHFRCTSTFFRDTCAARHATCAAGMCCVHWLWKASVMLIAAL